MSKGFGVSDFKWQCTPEFGVAQVNNLSPSVTLGLKPGCLNKRVSLERLNTLLLAWIDLLGH